MGCFAHVAVVVVVVVVIFTLHDCKIKWALSLERYSWFHDLEEIKHHHYFLFMHSECVWRNSLKTHGSDEEQAE